MADYHSSLTGPDIDAALTRAKAGGEIDIALGGKAPSGYGIGEENAARVTDTDLAALKKGGTYYIGTGCTNTPPNTDPAWSTLHVIPGRACTQIFIPANDANRAGTFTSWIARIYNDKTAAWGEWEWINPPMAVGVEYRTTERYLGKPVYVKAVSVGAMPAASGASNRIMVGFNPSNLEKIVRWEGTVTDGTMVCTLPVDASNGMVVGLYGYWYSGIIYIESNGDYSGYSGTLTFWYTKTTD